MNKSRFLLGLVFLAVIAWLVLSPRKGNRQAELNQALQAGVLGRLPDSTARGLNRLLSACRSYLGIREPVCLNCAMDSSAKLRVYTCGPAVLRLTGCAAGNAIYDRELNAVFIDGSLVSPEAWNAKGTFGAGHATLPFLEVYLKFVLLHELGHYFLHRNAGRSFDVFSGNGSATLRRYETQADSFAVAHFTAIMAVDTAGTLFSPVVFENLAMNVDAKASASDKTLLCLTLMARNINLGMLFGVSPYSEFYADKAHPTFMSRSAGFLSRALEAAPVKDKYYAKADWIRAQLLEIGKLAATHAILEVSVPAPLLNLGFDRDGLLVETLDSGLYRAGADRLKLSAEPGVTEAGVDRVASNEVFFDLDALYSFSTGGVFSSGNGRLMTWNGGRWQAAAFRDGVPRHLGKVAVQGQPANAFVYLGDQDSLYRVQANRILQGLGHREVAVKAAALLPGARLEILWEQPLITGPDIRLTVLQQNGLYWKLAGALVPDFAHQGIGSMERFNLDEPRLALAAGQYDLSKSRLLYDPQNKGYYLLTSQVPGLADVKMQLWQLFMDRRPRLVSERAFLNGGSPARELLEIAPTLADRSVAYLSGADYIVNWDDDLIYRVGLESGAMEPVFHFGAGTLGLRVSNNGQLAIFSPMAYKFYVMRP